MSALVGLIQITLFIWNPDQDLMEIESAPWQDK